MHRAALAVISCLLLAAMGTVAYYMLTPVDWDGLGQFGAAALMFPFHLLAVTIVSAGLGVLAWRVRARVAAAVFGMVVLLSTFSALWPGSAMGRLAWKEHVPLSLGVYLANAGRLNVDGPQPERTIQYGTAADGTKLVLDVWRAAGTGSGRLRPAIVMVHGGAWVAGTRSMLADWNRWLNGLGYDVFDVEYRLAPPARWQDAVGDVKCALGWVATNAGRYQVDPARISTWGHSAGGQLAMLAAYSMGDPRFPPSCEAPAVAVRSVVNIYGPADLPVAYDSSGSLAYVRNAFRTYMGGTPTEYPERYRAASPASHVSARTPPTITLLGTSDRIVPAEQAHILDRALTGAGVAHETWLLPANDHGFDVNWGGFGTQFARDRIRYFLERH